MAEHGCAASTMIAVTGVSGKGKSTLLNVMGGLLRPEAGSVRYRKIDLTQATAAQIDDIHRRGIGFVFQTPYLFQALTAYENLELALRASGEKVVRDRIFEMLEKLGLSERAEHLPRAIRWSEAPTGARPCASLPSRCAAGGRADE